MRPHGRRASVSTSNPVAFAQCDRCGCWVNRTGLQWQFQWSGTHLYNLGILVCEPCLDTPFEQLRTIILPPDPPPVINARPPNFTYEEAGPVQTYLTATTLAGGYNLLVDSAVGFVVGNYVWIQLNTGSFAQEQISGISGDTLTLEYPLPATAPIYGSVTVSSTVINPRPPPPFMPISILSGVGSLLATSFLAHAALGTFTGTSSLVVVSSVTRAGVADFNGIGSLSSACYLALAVQATLSGNGSLSAITVADLSAQATFIGAGSLSASAGALFGMAVFTGIGSLLATSKAALSGLVTLSGIGNLLVTVSGALKVFATFTGTGGLLVTTPPWLPLIGTTAPTIFADFTTEATTDNYWYNGTPYASSSALFTALSASFSRSSAAYYTNSSGLLASASSGVLRFNYDGSGNPLGILLEGASTNLLVNSAGNFNNGTGWATQTGTVTDNAGTAPDGTSTATLVNSTGVPIFASGANNRSLTAGVTYTFSCWIKNNGGSTSATIRNYNAPDSVYNTASISAALASGVWTRVSLTWTQINSGAAGSQLEPFNFTSGTGNAYVWGAQFEALPFASSYIPTTSSTATRAADSLEIPWTSATATFRIKSIGQTYAAAASIDLLAANTNSNGDILLGMGSATSLETIDSSGTLTLSSAVSAWGSSNVSGVAGNNLGRVLGSNNVTPTSDANPLFTATPADIWIGGGNAAYPAYGNIEQFGAWTVAASSAQLQTMTNTP